VDVLQQPIGRKILVHLGIAHRALPAASTRAADTCLGVDDDPVGINQLRRQKRRERRQRRCRIATRIGNTGGSADGLGPDVGQTVGPAIDVPMITTDIDNLDR
jgi:hypothetical protein